ncbi:hypothetical protein ACOSP7_019107 [Xanthoceras sorbifolium]
MGSECNPSKRRYDISMSKRTRKPLNMEYSYGNRTMEMGSSKRETPDDLKGVVDDEVDQEEEEEENDLKGVDDAEVDQIEEENDHKSLKQLINSDEKSKVKTSEESRGRNSLGEHFTKEEKQLQLVKTQQQKGVQKGVKFKGMVNRYVKVLSHLIKVKRDPHTIASRKKPLLRLTI